MFLSKCKCFKQMQMFLIKCKCFKQMLLMLIFLSSCEKFLCDLEIKRNHMSMLVTKFVLDCDLQINKNQISIISTNKSDFHHINE